MELGADADEPGHCGLAIVLDAQERGAAGRQHRGGDRRGPRRFTGSPAHAEAPAPVAAPRLTDPQGHDVVTIFSAAR